MARLCVVFVMLATAAGSAAAATHARPGLALVMRAPALVVRGTGFRPNDRITVTVGTAVGHVRATALGAFTMNTGVALDRCSAAIVRAVGAHGGIALLKLPRPACMPAVTP